MLRAMSGPSALRCSPTSEREDVADGGHGDRARRSRVAAGRHDAGPRLPFERRRGRPPSAAQRTYSSSCRVPFAPSACSYSTRRRAIAPAFPRACRACGATAAAPWVRLGRPVLGPLHALGLRLPRWGGHRAAARLETRALRQRLSHRQTLGFVLGGLSSFLAVLGYNKWSR